MLERTSTTERYARGFAAAVVAVTTLILAANAGPARAADRVTSGGDVPYERGVGGRGEGEQAGIGVFGVADGDDGV